jgi:hypothetical protein
VNTDLPSKKTTWTRTEHLSSHISTMDKLSKTDSEFTNPSRFDAVI